MNTSPFKLRLLMPLWDDMFMLFLRTGLPSSMDRRVAQLNHMMATHANKPQAHAGK